MLRIIVEDTEKDGQKGFKCDVTCAGTDEQLAQQLYSVIMNIGRRAPKVIDIMNYLVDNDLDLDGEEEEGGELDEV